MSGSGNITFRTPLQADENAFYTQQFRQLDKEDLGIVTGESAKPLFGASRLTATLLSQIWATVDTGNKGFLNYTEFSAALRMISHLQQRPNLPVTPALYEMPSGRLPMLGGPSSPMVPNGVPPVSGSPIGMGIGSPNPSTNLSTIPLIPQQDVAKFSQLYDRTAMGAPALPGDKAKEIFMKARLSTNILGEIWALCDRNVSGSLTKQEFVMAMYLIQLSMSKHPSVMPLPTALPSQLWNSINVVPTSLGNDPGHSLAGHSLAGHSLAGHSLAGHSSNMMPLSAHSTGNKPLSRQNTIQRLSNGVFNSASTDWSLGYDKKRQFDAIFDNLDKLHRGSLGPDVLVNFFLSSRLSQETLASIWDLADINNNAEFTKVEFAIAMFLIQKKNAGVELPDVIPDQLLHSAALEIFPNQQQSKPAFQEPQQQMAPVQVRQHTNSGSLNDLLALNSSFASPSPQHQPVMRQPSTFSRDSTGGSIPTNSYGHASAAASNSGYGMNRNYTPQTDLGQNVIQEESEEITQPYSQPRSHMFPQSSGGRARQPQLSGGGNYTSPGNIPTSSLPHSTTGAGLSKNNDLYADAEASAQLSNATTEVANLSNQLNSLTKQASITSDKKTRATQELRRVNAQKASIESKLQELRGSHTQNVREAEELESKLVEETKGTALLEQQLTAVEGNYHALESKVNGLTQSYEEARKRNHDLRSQISNLNTMASSLQAQLADKQRQAKQERSMVDVNAKQMELNQFTAANFENEIKILGEKLQLYLNKRKELNDYQKTVEQQHGQLQVKYQQLEARNHDLTTRGQDLERRRRELKEQEKAYQQQSLQLQAMAEDVNRKKAAQNSTLGTGFALNAGARSGAGIGADALASGTNASNRAPQPNEPVTLGSKDIKPNSNLTSGTVPSMTGATHADDVSKFVETTVAHSKLGGAEDEDRAESDVFDKDIPTVGSQTEADDESETRRERDRTENLADRFEGDLNEYGIPRTQSLTSSVANNAPQSVSGEPENQENLENATPRATAVDRGSVIPGQWGSSTSESAGISESAPNPRESGSNRGSRPIDNSVQRTSQSRPFIAGERTVGGYGNIDDEFPPIQELNVNETDTSSDEEVFQDTNEYAGPASNPSAQGRRPVDSRTRNVARTAASVPGASSRNGGSSLQGGQPSLLDDKVYPSGGQQNSTPNVMDSFTFDDRYVSPSLVPSNAGRSSVPASAGYHDEFDNEFAGLEQANEESAYESRPNGESVEEFEKIEHRDLDDELNGNYFTGGSAVNTKQAGNTNGVSNDEWDEIFAGFGNSNTPNDSTKQDANSNLHVESPVPSTSAPAKVHSPINRKIATTPKSLAVEELSGMGFTEQEAMEALEKCKWDLEAATNYLLDSA